MAKKKSTRKKKASAAIANAGSQAHYEAIQSEIAELIEAARRASVRSVNSIMTLTYWEIGRRIVEFEQGGSERADYGAGLLKFLSADLSSRFGRGFSVSNLEQMRRFYRVWPADQISQTVSGKLAPENSQTASGISMLPTEHFPLPWSHYVRLLSVRSEAARSFYEEEAIRGGWSARQLNRQIGSQFYERTALSKNKAAMIRRGRKAKSEDEMTADEQIKDPLVLEFLDLKDEYSESDLEEALIHKLESLLLELGGDFAFVGRQRRLRIGDAWYRIDLLFFHRRLKCLVVIDLKLGAFSHADAGQMHMYLNYAREHWTLPDENPPVGLILCASKDDMLVRYSLDGLPNKVLATEYRLALPDEKTIAAKLKQTRRLLETQSPKTRKTKAGRRKP